MYAGGWYREDTSNEQSQGVCILVVIFFDQISRFSEDTLPMFVTFVLWLLSNYAYSLLIDAQTDRQCRVVLIDAQT